MKVISIVIVQDEADIVEEVLRDAALMTDLVLIYDTGSVDGTLDMICKLQSEFLNIHIIQNKPVHFHEFETRRHALLLASNYLKDGDWVAWLDADEFFGIKPSLFIKNYCEFQKHNWIRHRHYNFSPTEVQVEEYPEYFYSSKFDRTRYIYYKEYPYTETKLFQYRTSCLKTIVGRNPRWLGSLCCVRIPILHYPYRTVPQIKRRTLLRNFSKKQFSSEVWGRHWKEISLSSALYTLTDTKVKEYYPQIISKDLLRLDGCYDSRESRLQRLFTVTKKNVARIMTIAIGLECIDKFLSKKLEVSEPSVRYKDSNFIAEYKKMFLVAEQNDF